MFEPSQRQARHRSQSAGRGAGSVNRDLEGEQRKTAETSIATPKVSWAAAASQLKDGARKDSKTDCELTQIRQMLEILASENKELKAKLSRYGQHSQAKANADDMDTTNAEEATNATSQTNTRDTKHTQLRAVELQQGNTDLDSTESDVEQPLSPPSKKRCAGDAQVPLERKARYIQTQIEASVDQKLENIEKRMDSKLEEIRTMIASLADSITKQFAAMNTRITALENANCQLQHSAGGGVGPIKSSKPYMRPATEGIRPTSLDSRAANRTLIE